VAEWPEPATISPLRPVGLAALSMLLAGAGFAAFAISPTWWVLVAFCFLWLTMAPIATR
jgi:hypothetical protein